MYYAVEPYRFNLEVLQIILISFKDQLVLYYYYIYLSLFHDYKVFPPYIITWLQICTTSVYTSKESKNQKPSDYYPTLGVGAE